jgi:hypothetical protein
MFQKEMLQGKPPLLACLYYGGKHIKNISGSFGPQSGHGHQSCLTTNLQKKNNQKNTDRLHRPTATVVASGNRS